MFSQILDNSVFIYCTYIKNKSYGSHREMHINKTRSPTVEKYIMDNNLQRGPMKRVQETHFLFFFFFCKNSFYFKIHINDKNHLFHKHLKIKLSLSSWKFIFHASQVTAMFSLCLYNFLKNNLLKECC